MKESPTYGTFLDGLKEEWTLIQSNALFQSPGVRFEFYTDITFDSEFNLSECISTAIRDIEQDGGEMLAEVPWEKIRHALTEELTKTFTKDKCALVLEKFKESRTNILMECSLDAERVEGHLKFWEQAKQQIEEGKPTDVASLDSLSKEEAMPIAERILSEYRNLHIALGVLSNPVIITTEKKTYVAFNSNALVDAMNSSIEGLEGFIHTESLRDVQMTAEGARNASREALESAQHTVNVLNTVHSCRIAMKDLSSWAGERKFKYHLIEVMKQHLSKQNIEQIIDRLHVRKNREKLEVIPFEQCEMVRTLARLPYKVVVQAVQLLGGSVQRDRVDPRALTSLCNLVWSENKEEREHRMRIVGAVEDRIEDFTRAAFKMQESHLRGYFKAQGVIVPDRTTLALMRDEFIDREYAKHPILLADFDLVVTN